MGRHYEDFIEAYVRVIAPKGEAPERFHFWTAVSTVAGALRRRVYLDAGTFRWYPNFYIILVGPPGIVKKSTVINIGARLLREVPNINIGADCTTWQSFVEEIGKAKDMFAEGDPTQGNLDDMLSRQYTVTSAVSLQISELGTFLDPNDKQMVNILTELWDCKLDQSFVKKTKTQGEDSLMNPFVNLIAGTTPQWMTDSFKSQFGGWGLSSRCIFIHCDKRDRFVALPAKLWAGKHDEIMGKFADDLRAISTLQGPYALAHDAEWFLEGWYKEHGRRHEQFEAHPHRDPWVSYYFARKYDHVVKLALVLAAARREELVITLQDVQDAVGRCDQIEEEISNIFHTRRPSSAETELRGDVWNGICAAMIRHGGEIEEWQVHSYCRNFMAGGKAEELIRQMIAARFLVRQQSGAVTYFGFGEGAQFDTKALVKVLPEDTLKSFLIEIGAITEPALVPLPQSQTEPEKAPLTGQEPPASPQPPQSPPHGAETLPSDDPFLGYRDGYVPPFGSEEEDPVG